MTWADGDRTWRTTANWLLRPRRGVFVLLFISASVLSLRFMFAGWSGSLLELHSFRQTQTAISVASMLKSGDILHYQTPVLGPPWEIPMEFPFFQALVFVLVRTTGYPLDQAGRAISLLLFLATLPPFYLLIRTWTNERSTAVIALVLVCLSPQYIYWSRSFMIESAALSTSIWYLYLVQTHLAGAKDRSRRVALLAAITVLGTLSALTKVTTFVIYFAIALFMISLVLLREGVQEKPMSRVGRFFREYGSLTIAAAVIPILLETTWVFHSDHVKSLNPLGAALSSKALIDWNFGTLAQKCSWDTWKQVLERSVTDLFGDVQIAFVFFALPLCKRTTGLTSALLIFMFVFPIAIFTNLYYVHSYYGYANGMVLIAALALIIGDLVNRNTVGYWLAIGLVVVTTFKSVTWYTENYRRFQGNPYRYQDLKAIADRFTAPDEVLVLFGMDWSSEIPYYLDRRALMLPTSLTTEVRYRQATENLRSYTVGGVLFCGTARYTPEQISQVLKAVRVRPGVRLIVGRCDCIFRGSSN